MGSLYQKSDRKGSWVFQYKIDGKKKYVTNGLSNLGSLNLKEHRKVLLRLENKFEGVYNHIGDKIPKIRQVINDVISERKIRVSLQTLSENTVRGDERRLEYFWDYLKSNQNYHLSELIITSINTKMLNGYMDYCRKVKKHSSTSIHNNMMVVRLLVNYSIKNGYVTENPFNKIDIPKPRRRGVEDIPSKNEYSKISNHLEEWVDNYLNDEDEFSIINTIVYIQTKTGMRGGEVKLMKWKRGKDDIGKNHSFSYVYLSDDFKKIIIHFKRRFREVPIHPKLVKLLKKVKTDTQSKTFVLEGHNNTTKSLNEKYLGKKLDDSYGRVRNGEGRVPPIVKLWKKVGLSNFYSLHCIRHGFVSHLVRLNTSFKKIGDIIGHSHQTVTERYSHLRSEDMEDILFSI